MENIYEELISMKKRGQSCIMVTVIEMTGNTPVTVGKKMLVDGKDNSIGTVGGGALEYYAKQKCRELLISQQSKLEKYILNEGEVVTEGETVLPMACGGRVTLFYEYIGVKAKVYIFGAGHVGQALTKVLSKMNFYITVIDDRKDIYDTVECANRKVQSTYVNFIENEELDLNSYIIVCTPSHKNDFNVINKVLELKLKPKYIGMLCSQVKLKTFLDKIHDKFGKVDLSNLYSPIGLDTGGCSPEEIAISIASEILAISYGKKGHKHLRNNGLIDN
ncbi:xanthine dehydrogenase accessory factor [Vallitalea longa]|uniref:Xanthine dehydrogenase accessory factor n=1 Tax=Vallitalea longa TaxID=2936439 RepID=A0A9W5YDQ3_9FIRM|nr:XdhC/CoxI family protein [Vallitalea longa]GKX30039.1 xanthine dehydrogenase accessory factor [Vallitalea longa]